MKPVFVLAPISLLSQLPLVASNLLHVPGVTVTHEMAAERQRWNATRELYHVCSVAEDDEAEHVLEFLEDPTVEVNWVNHQEGMSCLFAAVMRGKLQVVETLLDWDGVDINLPRESDQVTPIQAAAMYGRVHILKAFAQRGLLVQNDSAWEVPLIHRACAGFNRAHITALQYLVLEQNADINVLDATGHTCWDVATQRNLREKIEQLGGKSSVSLRQQTVPRDEL